MHKKKKKYKDVFSFIVSRLLTLFRSCACIGFNVNATHFKVLLDLSNTDEKAQYFLEINKSSLQLIDIWSSPTSV